MAEYIHYYNVVDGKAKAVPAGQTGDYSITFTDRQEYYNGANPDNVIYDSDTDEVRMKTEAELLVDLKVEAKRNLSKAIQAYIYKYYDAGKQASMQMLKQSGTTEQHNAIDEIWTWVYTTVQKNDYYVRVSDIDSATTIAELETAVADYDFSNNDASKPSYSYADIVAMDV